MKIEEERLAEEMRRGNPLALEAAMDLYGPTMLSLVRRVMVGVGSSEDLEECVSDAFWAAWCSMQRYDESRGSFRTWLLVLAKYKALDARRRLLRQIENIGPASGKLHAA